MATNYKREIVEHLESKGLFYSLWNMPSRNPHRVCISNDESMRGNAWGKLVIEGKTWRKIHELLTNLNLTPDIIADRKLHEVPDSTQSLTTLLNRG
jgi:hypothetical protein